MSQNYIIINYIQYFFLGLDMHYNNLLDNNAIMRLTIYLQDNLLVNQMLNSIYKQQTKIKIYFNNKIFIFNSNIVYKDEFQKSIVFDIQKGDIIDYVYS